ncbi:MAG: hypothetical protein ACK5L5_11900 [Bacteroidales bacterium]
MILLSITGLFRVVLILVLLYYGIKLFAKYVLPSLIVDEKEKREQAGAASTKFKRTQTNKQIIPDNEGEYVDFEEVEDK